MDAKSLIPNKKKIKNTGCKDEIIETSKRCNKDRIENKEKRAWKCR